MLRRHCTLYHSLISLILTWGLGPWNRIWLLEIVDVISSFTAETEMNLRMPVNTKNRNKADVWTLGISLFIFDNSKLLSPLLPQSWVLSNGFPHGICPNLIIFFVIFIKHFIHFLSLSIPNWDWAVTLAPTTCIHAVTCWMHRIPLLSPKTIPVVQ